MTQKTFTTKYISMITQCKCIVLPKIAILLLPLTIFMSQCRKDDFKGETTGICPAVVSVDPANGTTNVFINRKITIIFNEPMDSLTINSSSFALIKGTGALKSTSQVNSQTGEVAGTFSFAGNTATFTAANDFAANTKYSGTIYAGIKDLQGNALPVNYVWSFTTGIHPDFTRPTISVTDPANNSSNIALNKTITTTFSESMDPATINSASYGLKLGNTIVPGVISFNGKTAVYTPTDNLLSGNTYTVTVTSSAKDLAGNALITDYTWTFDTKAPLGPLTVNLKSVSRFGIIAGVGVSNNAGFSIIRNMDVGISPGERSSISGFPPAVIVNGDMFASDDLAPLGATDMLTQAKQDLTDAYLFAEAANSVPPVTVSGDLGGKTLAPGIYKTTSTLLVQSGDLTLDAQGDVNATWIFQIASAFTTVGGAGGNIKLTGGARAKNIFWQTGSSATIGDNTSFKGNILALTSITLNSGATVVGRMLVQNGSVVLTNTNIIDMP